MLHLTKFQGLNWYNLQSWGVYIEIFPIKNIVIIFKIFTSLGIKMKISAKHKDQRAYKDEHKYQCNYRDTIF